MISTDIMYTKYYEYTLVDDDILINNIVLFNSKIICLRTFLFFDSLIIPKIKLMTSTDCYVKLIINVIN